MSENSFVKSLMRTPPQGAIPEVEPAWRKAFWVDNAGSGGTFSVSVRFRDGRVAEGFSPGLYLRHAWIDQGGPRERLVWLFSHGGIYLEGRHLQRGLDGLEEGRLKRIQEHGETEIALIESHNLDIRKPEEKEPIIFRVVISPRLSAVLENDANLSEIAEAMREKNENR